MTHPPIETLAFPDVGQVRRSLSPLVLRHLDWLRDQSRRHNLTRVPEEDWFTRHVLDSLAPYFADWTPGESFVDIGTGPGFPGVPLGIQFGDSRFLLVESKKKVARLLEAFLTANELAPRGEVAAERIEDLGRLPEHRGRHDCVVTRALASLPVLLELGIPLLREGGELWCWKSDISELNDLDSVLAELRSAVARVLEYRLPGETRCRIVIAIRKEGPTPDRHPRKSGVPQKKPLS